MFLIIIISVSFLFATALSMVLKCTILIYQFVSKFQYNAVFYFTLSYEWNVKRFFFIKRFTKQIHIFISILLQDLLQKKPDQFIEINIV